MPLYIRQDHGICPTVSGVSQAKKQTWHASRLITS